MGRCWPNRPPRQDIPDRLLYDALEQRDVDDAIRMPLMLPACSHAAEAECSRRTLGWKFLYQSLDEVMAFTAATVSGLLQRLDVFGHRASESSLEETRSPSPS